MIQTFFFLFFFAFTTFAVTPTDIVRKGDSILRGKSQQSLMKMTVQRESYTRNLTLRSWTSTNDNSLVEIIQPSKEEGISSLRKKAEMWNYLPKTDQVIRVPTSMMLQSWMGSDFTNDDLMKLSSMVDNYTHKLIKTEKVEGVTSDLIECLPKPNAPVVWGKILYWARKSDSLPIKEEYFDEKNNLVRTLTLKEFKKMDDRVIPTLLTINKAGNENEFTQIKYEEVYFDREIPENVFEKEKLKTLSQSGKDLKNLWFNVFTGT